MLLTIFDINSIADLTLNGTHLNGKVVRNKISQKLFLFRTSKIDTNTRGHELLEMLQWFSWALKVPIDKE